MKLMKRISFGSIVPGPYICQRSLRIIHHTTPPPYSLKSWGEASYTKKVVLHALVYVLN